MNDQLIDNIFGDPESEIYRGRRVRELKTSPKELRNDGNASHLTDEIREDDTHYIMRPIIYRNSSYEVSVAKEWLPDVNTPTEWIDYLRDTQEKLASAPLQMLTLMFLYDKRNESPLVERVREELRGDYHIGNWIANSSRVIIAPTNGTDKIIHEHGMPDEYSIDANVIGSDGWNPLNMNDRRLLLSLTGIDSMERFREMMIWLTGDEPKLYRKRSRDTTAHTISVGIGTSIDDLMIDLTSVEELQHARGWSWKKIGDPGTGDPQ
jgi:hypothetical protein